MLCLGFRARPRLAVGFELRFKCPTFASPCTSRSVHFLINEYRERTKHTGVIWSCQHNRKKRLRGVSARSCAPSSGRKKGGTSVEPRIEGVYLKSNGNALIASRLQVGDSAGGARESAFDSRVQARRTNYRCEHLLRTHASAADLRTALSGRGAALT